MIKVAVRVCYIYFDYLGWILWLFQISQPQATTNKQTTDFCGRLEILDPMALLIGSSPAQPLRRSSAYSLVNYVNERETNLSMNSTFNPDEISVNTEEEEEEEGKGDVKVEEASGKGVEETQSSRAPMRYGFAVLLI